LTGAVFSNPRPFLFCRKAARRRAKNLHDLIAANDAGASRCLDVNARCAAIGFASGRGETRCSPKLTWAKASAAASSGPAAQPLVFSLGALPMRSAGSTVNDMADRKYDAHVERTRFRPLAGGQLQIHQAFAFLMIELGLAASLLFFPTPFTRMVAVCVLPLVFVYPLCMRSTYSPQVVSGAAFNWGMLMA
jgi:hypothetical protein